VDCDMMVVRAPDVVSLLHLFSSGDLGPSVPMSSGPLLVAYGELLRGLCLLLPVDATACVAQSCMGTEPPTPVPTSDAACPAAIASSVVAPVASATAIACYARWAAITVSCASKCSVDAMLADASAAACCRFISRSAFLSNWVWSSCSFQGSVL